MELVIRGTARGPSEVALFDRLEQRAKSDPRIRLAGAVDPEQRYEALADMDLLAVPSTWLEAGPLVVLEAFAVGIPVLGSDLGGIAERVEPGRDGRLVPPGDVAAWTAALSELANGWRSGDWPFDPEEPRTSERVATEMETLYTEILGEA